MKYKQDRSAICDKPRESCGVIGLYTPSESIAKLAYFGLCALQHRGQEAAGIAVADGKRIQKHVGVGLVSQVFNEENLNALQGHVAIGHVRYSTIGASILSNAQPFVMDTDYGPLAMGHNGNLTNLDDLCYPFFQAGIAVDKLSDSRIMAMMLAQSRRKNWIERLQAVMSLWEGAYCLTIATRDELMAIRDPWGFRPLSLGELPDDSIAVASETNALKVLGCEKIREVEPGEIISVSSKGLQRARAQMGKVNPARCTFEQIYFSRPDSNWDGLSVYQVRQRLGAKLAEEVKVRSDIVIPVPNSAIPAAIGFSRVSGIPYSDGFIKNRYIGRTFIQPTDFLRKQGVSLKFHVLKENVCGKRVVMMDDSIVRGNTAGPLVKLLRDAGAREVHVCVTCPPVRHPCYMGIDMGTYEELIAHKMDIEDIKIHLGCDSLHFLSLEGLLQALRRDTGYCNACFTGCYPLPIKGGLNQVL